MFDARRLKGLGDYVSAVLRPVIGQDSLRDGATAQEYFRAVAAQYVLSHSDNDLTPIGAETEETQRATDEFKAPPQPTSHAKKIWAHLMPLIMGERGPFQIEGRKSRSTEAALLCEQLWPCGAPNVGDEWNCAPDALSQSTYAPLD